MPSTEVIRSHQYAVNLQNALGATSPQTQDDISWAWCPLPVRDGIGSPLQFKLPMNYQMPTATKVVAPPDMPGPALLSIEDVQVGLEV